MNCYAKIFINLQAIYFDINSLEYLVPGAFDGLTSLEVLVFYSHTLRSVPELRSVMHSLMTFSLMGSASALYDDVNLGQLAVLENLKLDRLGITSVPKGMKHFATSLRYLSLFRNNISTLDGMYNIPFPTPTVIYMGYNRIYHLSPTRLLFPVLVILDLKYNALVYLADMSSCTWGMDLMADRTLLSLSNNPWHCNGSMDWISKSLCRHDDAVLYKGFNLWISLQSFICHSPPDVSGRMMLTVDGPDLQKLHPCGRL